MTQPDVTLRSALPSTLRSYLSKPRNLVFIAAVAVVIASHAVVFFSTMLISPLGFDEAFILQAPLNLVQGNGYSTEDWDWRNAGENLQFDAIVSTGPLVLMPVALSFLLFGVSIASARIVMLPFTLILAGSLFVLGRRIGGRWVGLVSALAVLTLNTRADWPTTVIFGPSDVLGEYATAAMIALALVLLPRHRMAAGLVLGLATLAKFIAFMAVPAFMLALLLVPAVASSGWRTRVRELVGFVAAVIVPSIVWELVKFLSLGPVAYGESLLGYARFVFRSGSGVDGSGRVFFAERLSRMFAAWHVPTVVAIALGAALIVLAIVGIRYYFPARFSDSWKTSSGPVSGVWARFLVAARLIPVEIWAAAATLGAFTVWWSFIASSTFIRHTMPVMLVAVPILVALALRGSIGLWRGDSAAGRAHPLTRAVAAVGIASILGVVLLQFALTVKQSFGTQEWTRAQQQETAAFIRDLGVDEVQGFGWWASPEVRFLSGVPSVPLGTGTGPLVISPILRELDPANYDVALGYCEETLYENEGFVVCTVSPDVAPIYLLLDPRRIEEPEVAK